MQKGIDTARSFFQKLLDSKADEVLNQLDPYEGRIHGSDN
jgi:hypothetical protein